MSFPSSQWHGNVKRRRQYAVEVNLWNVSVLAEVRTGDSKANEPCAAETLTGRWWHCRGRKAHLTHWRKFRPREYARVHLYRLAPDGRPPWRLLLLSHPPKQRTRRRRRATVQLTLPRSTTHSPRRGVLCDSQGACSIPITPLRTHSAEPWPCAGGEPDPNYTCSCMHTKTDKRLHEQVRGHMTRLTTHAPLPWQRLTTLDSLTISTRQQQISTQPPLPNTTFVNASYSLVDLPCWASTTGRK